MGVGGVGRLFLARCNCGDVLMRPHTNKQLFELSLAHVLCMQKYVVSVVESVEVKTKKTKKRSTCFVRNCKAREKTQCGKRRRQPRYFKHNPNTVRQQMKLNSEWRSQWMSTSDMREAISRIACTHSTSLLRDAAVQNADAGQGVMFDSRSRLTKNSLRQCFALYIVAPSLPPEEPIRTFNWAPMIRAKMQETDQKTPEKCWSPFFLFAVGRSSVG